MAWQRQTGLTLGKTGNKLSSAGPSITKKPFSVVADGHVRVSVAGAHLKGQPFHQALCRLGAEYVRACRTAPKYRFFAFLELDPPAPGLLQTDGCGGAIAVEFMTCRWKASAGLWRRWRRPSPSGRWSSKMENRSKVFCANRRRQSGPAISPISAVGSPSAPPLRRSPSLGNPPSVVGQGRVRTDEIYLHTRHAPRPRHGSFRLWGKRWAGIGA